MGVNVLTLSNHFLHPPSHATAKLSNLKIDCPMELCRHASCMKHFGLDQFRKSSPKQLLRALPEGVHKDSSRDRCNRDLAHFQDSRAAEISPPGQVAATLWICLPGRLVGQATARLMVGKARICRVKDRQARNPLAGPALVSQALES